MVWAEPTGWTAPYFELRTVCHACGEAAGTMLAGFNPSSMHMCYNCRAGFTHEEGILRAAEKYARECVREARHGDKTEPELLRAVDKEIFGRAKFGSNATLQYTGYLEKDDFLIVPLPRSFRHPPRAFASVHGEGLDDTDGVFGVELPATLTEVQVPARGTTSSGDRIPIHLQVHGNIEDLGEDLPPHFTFLDDAFRAFVRRDYDLAVFLGATASEAFVSALLADRLSSGTANKDAIYELVSRAGAEHKVREVLPSVLRERLPKGLSKSYRDKVGKVRNEFAHGKRPSTTLVDALHALETCLSCMTWALRRTAEM